MGHVKGAENFSGSTHPKVFELFRRVAVGLLLAGVLFVLAGCDDDAGGVGMTYNMTDSGGRLLVGRGVGLASLDVAGTCSNFSGGTPTHTTDADVTTNGSVTLTFTVGFADAYVEVIYIDVDNSKTLTNGDWVWGTSTSLSAGCWNSSAEPPQPFNFDWQDAATALGFNTVVWAGGTAPFDASGDAPGVEIGTIVPLPAGRY